MDGVFENNVLETSTTPGTGWLALDPVPGFRRFRDALTAGKPCHYIIKEVDVVGRPTGVYEIGFGTYPQEDRLARAVVVESSSGNAFVNFGNSTKTVAFTALAPNNTRAREDWQDALGLNFAGAVAYCAAANAPVGWLKCNGAAVSRATYARLFNAIGTRFGAGDGSTFNLPDLRGEFIRSWDDGRTLDNGRALGTVQGGQNLSHAHGLSDPGHAHGVADPGHAHGAWTDSQGNHNHHVNDPGHAHGFSGPNGNTTTPGGGAFASNPLVGRATDASGTGIWLNDGGSHGHNVGIAASGTGIWIYGAGTGMWVNADGGAENRPRNVSMLACIKF